MKENNHKQIKNKRAVNSNHSTARNENNRNNNKRANNSPSHNNKTISKSKNVNQNQNKYKTKTRTKSNHNTLKKFLLIISIILIILLGVFTYKVYENGWGLQGFLSTLLGQNEETLADLDNLEFLLIGESGNMTDTIIACSYDPKTQQAKMLSIPRDTFIGDSESGATPSDKINSVYNVKKDPMNTVKAVNKVTGLNLKYYVFVDTAALIKLVDAIGGVEFDVPINMNYDDPSSNNIHIHLKKGTQTIDGKKAEQLLRFRHNNDYSSYPEEYGDNDLGRMRTQREFIKATLKQTLKASNVFKLNEILDISNKYVKTNLSIHEVKDYIPYAINFDTENLTSAMLPNESKKLNNWWFVKIIDSEARKLVNDMFYGGTKDVSEEEKKPITVELLNGSGNADNLEKVLNLLEKDNFDVVKVGNISTTKSTSIINRTKQENSIISKVSSILNVKAKSSSGKDNVNADLTITIGKDFK